MAKKLRVSFCSPKPPNHVRLSGKVCPPPMGGVFGSVSQRHSGNVPRGRGLDPMLRASNGVRHLANILHIDAAQVLQCG